MRRFIIKLCSEVSEKDVNLSFASDKNYIVKDEAKFYAMLEFCEDPISREHFAAHKWYTKEEAQTIAATDDWSSYAI